jgi:hypothetical protein
MVDVYLETIQYSINTAQLIGRTVYLKGANRTGWRLSDEPPDKPYFIVQPDGQTVEIRKDVNED